MRQQRTNRRPSLTPRCARRQPGRYGQAGSKPGRWRLKGKYCRPPCKSVVKGRRRCTGRVRENAQCVMSGFVVRVYASRRVVPALRRTGHPFAVSGSWEPSQKIELVFSASPKTIRREPREADLLRSVGNRQDLAVCASMILFLSWWTVFRLPGSRAVLQE
jgi:hypothetical protein